MLTFKIGDRVRYSESVIRPKRDYYHQQGGYEAKERAKRWLEEAMAVRRCSHQRESSPWNANSMLVTRYGRDAVVRRTIGTALWSAHQRPPSIPFQCGCRLPRSTSLPTS